MRDVAVVAALGLVMMTGCGTGPSDEVPEEIMADPYLIAEEPQQWVDWGSHVIVAEVTAEREIEVSYLLSNGQQGREVDLAVEQVLWSHPKAVTPVSAGQSVSLEVSPGWISGSPAVDQGAPGWRSAIPTCSPSPIVSTMLSRGSSACSAASAGRTKLRWRSRSSS